MSSGSQIFDRSLLRARQQRARSLGPETFLLDRVADDLADRLSAVLRHFDVAVDLGTPTDVVRRVLAASGKVTTTIAAEFAVGSDRAFLRIGADEETFPFPSGLLYLGTWGFGVAFCQH